jgi:hypothetical protein
MGGFPAFCMEVIVALPNFARFGLQGAGFCRSILTAPWLVWHADYSISEWLFGAASCRPGPAVT